MGVWSLPWVFVFEFGRFFGSLLLSLVASLESLGCLSLSLVASLQSLCL